jgi:tetratricopeptide (TPR) repeat protein
VTLPWLVLLLAAQSQLPAPPPDRAAIIAEARRLIDEGRPRDAIAKLEGMPSAPDVAHAIGVAYYHADDHARAIAALERIVGAMPAGSSERREVVQVLGLSLFLAGRLADALPYLEETRRWARDNLELGYVLGQAYIQLRQPDRARAALAEAFALPPDSAAAHLVAAQLMNRLEQEAQAEAEIARALEKEPSLPHAHYLLGQMAMFRGRLDEAVRLTEREIAINPGNAMAYYQLGDAHARQSRWEPAIAALQKSLWLNPFYSGPYILLGKAYMKKGQPSTAEGMLRRGIQYDPNNRTAHYLLAQLLQQTGRADEAKREFEIAEKLQGQPGR